MRLIGISKSHPFEKVANEVPSGGNIDQTIITSVHPIILLKQVHQVPSTSCRLDLWYVSLVKTHGSYMLPRKMSDEVNSRSLECDRQCCCSLGDQQFATDGHGPAYSLANCRSTDRSARLLSLGHHCAVPIETSEFFKVSCRIQSPENLSFYGLISCRIVGRR